MIPIHAIGQTDPLLEQLDLVMLLRSVVPADTKIEVIDDLEHRFGVNSKEFCWTFGVGCESVISQWVDQMKKDGYTFEGSTLLVDNGGFVAGIWAGKKQEEPVEEKKEDEETSESEVKATSALEIEAAVTLTGEDEDGKIKRFKVRGKYRRRREENVFALVDVIDINKDKDLKQEDIQAVLDWVNECNVNLVDFTLKGPAYTVDQGHVHNFGVQRICVENLHAIVLDKMIEALKKSRERIQVPQSATEMRTGGK